MLESILGTEMGVRLLTDESLFDRVMRMKVDEDGESDIKSGHKFIEVCLSWKRR